MRCANAAAAMACRRCAKAAASPTSRSSSGCNHEPVTPDLPAPAQAGVPGSNAPQTLGIVEGWMPEQVRHDEKRTTRGRHFMELGITRSAVVTGGASGLGAATARALAASGVKVAIFDLQAEKGEQIATEIGGTFCAVDVNSDESVDAGFAKIGRAHV